VEFLEYEPARIPILIARKTVLNIERIIYALYILDYLVTLEGGVVYIISTEGITEE
jgi:hypothetical protein